MTANTTAIADLIQRLQKAQAGDRDLDLAVLNATSDVEWDWVIKGQTVVGFRHGRNSGMNPICHLEKFTTSIDDALQLYDDPVWCRTVDATAVEVCVNFYRFHEGSVARSVVGVHKHESVATVIACLKMRLPAWMDEKSLEVRAELDELRSGPDTAALGGAQFIPDVGSDYDAKATKPPVQDPAQPEVVAVTVHEDGPDIEAGHGVMVGAAAAESMKSDMVMFSAWYQNWYQNLPVDERLRVDAAVVKTQEILRGSGRLKP